MLCVISNHSDEDILWVGEKEISLYNWQRWSPRGRLWPRGRPREHILKSLALASKVKSLALASKPQVFENWPVLGSRTAVFFELLKFCGALEKFFGKRFFFGEHLGLCPWSLALASSISVLGLESVCPRKGCPWPWSWPKMFFVSLASSLVSSTPPLITESTISFRPVDKYFNLSFLISLVAILVKD